MKKENKSGKNAPEHSDGRTPASPNQIDRVETNEEYNQRLRERLEEENGSEIINYNKLKVIAPEFAEWFKDIIRYHNVDATALMFLNNKRNDGQDHFSVSIYTSEHQYTFYGYKSKSDDKRGYLGAGVTTRKPRPGEDWNRGNDLPDGPYSKRTFDNIVNAIVAYELKTLQLWRK